MKILFLDIDGVVNCATSNWQHRGFIGIDPYMALLVHRIVEATGTKVVLSSTWRLGRETREEVRKQVVDFIDSTPSIDNATRGEEIQAWLDKPMKDGEVVEKYAILDDDIDMLPSQKSNFFQTSWEVGLTDEICKSVIAHLT